MTVGGERTNERASEWGWVGVILNSGDVPLSVGGEGLEIQNNRHNLVKMGYNIRTLERRYQR